jgi:hypothetical protein
MIVENGTYHNVAGRQAPMKHPTYGEQVLMTGDADELDVGEYLEKLEPKLV